MMLLFQIQFVLFGTSRATGSVRTRPVVGIPTPRVYPIADRWYIRLPGGVANPSGLSRRLPFLLEIGKSS